MTVRITKPPTTPTYAGTCDHCGAEQRCDAADVLVAWRAHRARCAYCGKLVDVRPVRATEVRDVG